jgi:hypothetical protein
MSVASLTTEVTVIGKTIRRSVSLETDGLVVKDPELAAAKVGALTTRTDDDTGELTMNSGHGITTGAVLDVYWGTGKRVGMTVGTVATNAVPIDGGTGDVLPADETAITAMVPQLETFPVTAADMDALFVSCGAAQATARFRESDTTPVVTISTTGSTGGYVWDEAGGATTPFGENVADVYLSHGDSSQAWPVSAVAMVG